MKIVVDINDVVCGVVYNGDIEGGIPISDESLPTDFVLNKYKYINGIGFLPNENYDKSNIESIIKTKIKELSIKCNEAITSGIDINNSHYSLTLEDQVNISELKNNAKDGISLLKYHADGEGCRVFSTEEILNLYNAALIHKNYHLTYFNVLKEYVQSLTDIDEINTIKYGQELVGEFLDRFNEIISDNSNTD